MASWTNAGESIPDIESGNGAVSIKPLIQLILFIAFFGMCATGTSEAGIRPDQRTTTAYQAHPAAPVPYSTGRVHRMGNIALRISNFGRLGSPFRGYNDPCTGKAAESFEFPIRSNVEYLYLGGLWIGAVRGKDTLVSVATDGWVAPTEFLPDPYPKGQILQRTTRPVWRDAPNSSCPDVHFSEEAISEQDFIALYTDTVTNPQYVNPDEFDGRHVPLGIEVTQSSYTWSFDYAKDFVLMDFALRNIGSQPLRQLYMGIFMDHDVGNVSTPDRQEDDISGFLHTIPSNLAPGFLDTLNVTWSADNDGDPTGADFRHTSATGAVGVRVVKAPNPGLGFSFNWWVTHSNPGFDWGPNRRHSQVDYLRGNLGSPWGDKAKYQLLSNGEFDYDQVECAVDHQAEGWREPVANAQLAVNIANGFDTRYLLSFGPFDLRPDSVLDLTIALVAGSDFHAEPQNFAMYFDPAKPEHFKQGLNFTGLARNAQWAGWVYDTPGFDTDGDGYSGRYRVVNGDTIYYAGDEVPDFIGPSPPPSPELRLSTSEGRAVVRWNGQFTETAIDHFSHVADFEGYRLYVGRTGQLSDYALVTQRDNVNYLRLRYRSAVRRWEATEPPFALDSLSALYDALVASEYGYPRFAPDSFKVRDRDFALREIVLDPIDPSKLDTHYYCFEPFDANEMPDDVELALLVDTLQHEVPRVIRKRFPLASPEQQIEERGIEYAAYYEYECVIDGLQPAEPVFFAVTALDFGDPAAGLSPLESSPLVNATEVWPINAASVVDEKRPRPGVYPNPYRLADDYNASGWENPRGEEPDTERARKITFTNVPDTCTVSIWSLDGDLVRRLDHAEHPQSSQATVVVWDLISRNTQAVKTGIYVYSIESRYGTDVGKLVIIK